MIEFFSQTFFLLIHFALYFGWYRLGKLRGYENGVEFVQERCKKICENEFENHKRHIKFIVLDELMKEGKIKISDVSYE